MTSPSSSKKEAKAVLITGAAGGIGQAIVTACLQQGWFVFANVRSQASWERLLSNIQERCPDATQYCQALIYDVTDPEQVKSAFNDIRKSAKPLLGLVNNAGVMLDAGIAMTSMADFTQQMTVNVNASFQHLQLASRLMTRNKTGSIINLSSLVAMQGSAGQVAYSTSKAALLGMTRSAAKELAPLGIRVNAIAPGFIDTQMTNDYQGDKRQALIDNIAVGRAGEARDVSALVLHLLSTEAAYITGQTIKIDGMMELD